MTPIITVPDASSTLASIGAWSSPIFNAFSPIIWIAAGLAVGALIVAFLLESITGAFSKFLLHRRDDKY